MFINNINGVINKNLSLFFFPSDIKLAWKAKQKQQELTENQLFFISLFFFLNIQSIRKSKTPIFERGQHKNFKQAQQKISNLKTVLDFLLAENNKKEIKQAYILKYSLKGEDTVILLIIKRLIQVCPNKENVIYIRKPY